MGWLADEHHVVSLGMLEDLFVGAPICLNGLVCDARFRTPRVKDLEFVMDFLATSLEKVFISLDFSSARPRVELLQDRGLSGQRCRCQLREH